MQAPAWWFLLFGATLAFGLVSVRREAPGGWPWGPHPASWRDERRQWSWVLQGRAAVVLGGAGLVGGAAWLVVR